jgi:hypothetical protein
MKLFASGVKSFAHCGSCVRIKYALLRKEIDWHGRLPPALAPPLPYRKMDTSWAAVKHNSDKYLDLQLPGALGCKSICGQSGCRYGKLGYPIGSSGRQITGQCTAMMSYAARPDR